MLGQDVIQKARLGADSMATRVKIATFDAVGGPAKLQSASDGFYAGPTDAGIYRRVFQVRKHGSRPRIQRENSTMGR